MGKNAMANGILRDGQGEMTHLCLSAWGPQKDRLPQDVNNVESSTLLDFFLQILLFESYL